MMDNTSNIKTQSKNTESIQVSDFGITEKGDCIRKYTLINKNGMRAEIINYGGIITSLTAPDKNGKYEDIVLGFVKPEDYFSENSYFFGAIIGRFANRIAGARFSLDGKTYDLAKNNYPNHLHGGEEGFFAKVWEAEIVSDSELPTVKLVYVSPDGEEGYPGRLTATVFYTLTNEDSLQISYEAFTDEPTIVNLTHHSYFNLSGEFSQPINDHELQLNADQFIPINNSSIPVGHFMDVTGTPFDFRVSKLIGKEINEEDEQLKTGNGYDHCWILNGNGMRSVGMLYHPGTGRSMEVLTDQPGVQFYSGNFLDGRHKTKNGSKNEARTGLCLETQHYPDSPNQDSFPSVKLMPGQRYTTKTIYKFSVK